MSPAVAVAILAIATGATAQRTTEQQRIFQLIGQLGVEETRFTAASELVSMGERAAEGLMEYLDMNPLDLVRVQGVLEVLGRLGPEAGDASQFLAMYAESAPAQAKSWVVRARADLAPYSGEHWQTTFHRWGELNSPVIAEWFREHVRHFKRMNVGVALGVEQLIAVLERNELFSREVAAEQLARMGPDADAALTPLRNRLLDRDGLPKGWDSLKHNGVVVPMTDGFALRAAEAVLRIDAHGVRSAVAHGYRAADHPDPAVRMEALAALGSLGTLAEEAVPELLRAVRDTRPEVAVEALKVLGMVGPAAAAGWPVIDELAAREGEDTVTLRARALRKQIEAMAPEQVEAHRNAIAKLAEETAVAAERTVEIREQIAAYTDDESREEVVQALIAMGEPALVELTAALDRVEDRRRILRILRRMGPATAPGLPLMIEWLQRNRRGAGSELLELMTELGIGLDAGQRIALGQLILSNNQDRWQTDMMSIGMGGGMPADANLRLHARLVIGKPSRWSEMTSRLTHENPFVRSVACEIINAWLVDGRAIEQGEELVNDLTRAAVDEHPKEYQVEVQPRSFYRLRAQMDAEIQLQAVNALEKLTKHSDPATALLAAEALRQVRGK